MRIFLEKVIRYSFRKKEDILVFIGLFSAMIVFYEFSVFYYKINQEDRYYEYYRFSLKSYVSYEGKDADQMRRKAYGTLVERLLEINNGNIGCEISVRGNGSLEEQKINILLRENENVSFLEGVRFTQKDAINGIYVGKSIYNEGDAGENGFQLNDEISLPIVGVLANHMAGGYDDSAYVLWNHCDQLTQQKLMEIIEDQPFINITMESNQDLSEEYRELEKKLNDVSLHSILIGAKNNLRIENRWYRTYNYVFQVMAFLFAILCCTCVFYYWTNSMTDNIVVRMSCGYGVIRMTGFLFARILSIAAYAFGAFFLFEILRGDQGNGQDVSIIRGIFEIMKYMMIQLFILIALTLCVTLNKIRNCSLCEMMRTE